jgi:predicted nucleic acid-binding protein
LSERTLFVAEPPADWLRRQPAVVDCSVLAALLWNEPAAGEAAGQLAGKALHAPALLVYELANVARTKCRAGVPADAALAGLVVFDEQRVLLHAAEPEALSELAQRYGLTAYDAAYLSLAGTLNAPLLTFDHRLGAAAARYLSDKGPAP